MKCVICKKETKSPLIETCSLACARERARQFEYKLHHPSSIADDVKVFHHAKAQIEKVCTVCGMTFLGGNRRIRCNPCQDEVVRTRSKKRGERFQAKKKEGRENENL